MPRIFISYRREDTAGYAGRLYDDLRDHFGREQVFMDIDTIDPGTDFVETIQNAVHSFDVVIVLIGRRWLTMGGKRRRLDNPDDWVRLEIETALGRGIRVVPVLVQGAKMPNRNVLPESLAMLARRQAFVMSDVRWEADVRTLIESLKRVPTRGQPAEPIIPPTGSGTPGPDRNGTGEISPTREAAAQQADAKPVSPILGSDVDRKDADAARQPVPSEQAQGEGDLARLAPSQPEPDGLLVASINNGALGEAVSDAGVSGPTHKPDAPPVTDDHPVGDRRGVLPVGAVQSLIVETAA